MSNLKEIENLTLTKGKQPSLHILIRFIWFRSIKQVGPRIFWPKRPPASNNMPAASMLRWRFLTPWIKIAAMFDWITAPCHGYKVHVIGTLISVWMWTFHPPETIKSFWNKYHLGWCKPKDVQQSIHPIESSILLRWWNRINIQSVLGTASDSACSCTMATAWLRGPDRCLSEELTSKIWFSFGHYFPGFLEDIAKTCQNMPKHQPTNLRTVLRWLSDFFEGWVTTNWGINRFTLNHLEPIYYHENQVDISDSYVSWRFQQFLPAWFFNGPEIVLESVLKIHPNQIQ